jgi:hypothetical protein
VTESDVFAKSNLQGAASGVGWRKAGATVTVETAEFTFEVANATMLPPVVGFDGKERRVREMTLKATRKFTAGAIQPLFTLTLA